LSHLRDLIIFFLQVFHNVWLRKRTTITSNTV